MADIDELLGLSEPAPTKAKPAPKRPAKTAAAETENPAPAAPAGPSAAEVKAAQQAAITAATDELAQLWREIGQGVTCPGPEDVRVSPKGDDEESADYVTRLWNQRFEQEQWRRRMFGCNAPATAEAHQQGVRIFAEVAPHLDPEACIETFQREALALGVGHYDGAALEGRGPHGGHGVGLWRQVVGADPATPFRAVNHRVFELYADVPLRRDKMFFFAGLGVKKQGHDWRFPRIIECIPDAGRGPAFVIQLLPGQDAADVEAALPKLRGLLRCDLELVERKPGIVELRLLHRKEASWPDQVPLSPRQLWRPGSRAEGLLAAKSGILLPVGVDRDGKPLMVNLRERPHVLIAGTSGAGKSTLLRLQLRALQMQLAHGGLLILADAKGADMRTVYAAGVGQNLSIETASIHRAITYAFDLMERRKLVYKRLVAQGIPDVFEPCVVVIDEFGAFAALGLSDGASAADKSGIQAAMIRLRHVLRQGRSLGVHIILSTQDVAKESGIDQKLLGVMRVRIMVGRPEEGSGGHLVKLFTEGERPAVRAATSHIGPNDQGLGVTVTADGAVTAFKAFYNSGQAADAFDRAVTAAGRRPRFGWEFPDDEGAWLQRTCADASDLPAVDSIPVIALETTAGNPIPGRARYDEGSADYDPGSPPLNAAHAEF
ncbi:ftsk/SpoIIIE family protein, putative [Mycobacteroides abscessus subsp. massiliense]|uniref:FtsK/SpoIIIE domain-containing protein n=1 Tax=Mycobacteroides abscessus TaxID=36809 RepID=UPI0009A86ECA|nr:FtsK/SpoIIIE domain-containing protein [Mycobacteroides abscessus]SLH42657.1 ftsk/SpoIIIE family protein, putative [Mycobacteroides abscessus subsp. massiliense]